MPPNVNFAAALAATSDSDFPAGFVPIILGGDIGVYALGREFHEAYGTKSVCIVESPIGAIQFSRIFAHLPVPVMNAAAVVEAITQIHERYRDKKLLLLANMEFCVPVVLAVRDELPYVLTPTPTAEVIDRVSHKDRFTELCLKHGLDVPQTEIVPLAGHEPIAPTRLAFPVVAKAAYSPEYAPYMMMHGFKKVYFLEQQAQLDELWQSLRQVGFAGTFIVQELVEGDDTYQDSVTIYMDSHGRPTMLGGANVLLGDHAPFMLGNPVAMITTEMPEIWGHCIRLLSEIGYQGFANFDIKRDPRTGKSLFFEVNVRIGRNSYYNCAAGVNPMRRCVEDLVFGRQLEPARAEREILYTLVPTRLLRRYVREPELLRRLDSLIQAGEVCDPQLYPADRDFRRMLSVQVTRWNQYRKFRRYYPDPTDTSF